MKQLCLLSLIAVSAFGQTAVSIQIDAARKIGPYKPIYAYFGYDEPNYTYTKNGRKLLGELGALSAEQVYIRTHFLLATGDATPGLKWGSTNAYTIGPTGKPVYDWKVSDQIFDAQIQAGAKPFVEIGFMPQALSSKPESYSVKWIPGAPNQGYYSGWSYPPSDYSKWGELVYQWVHHCVEKYGRDQVASWYWEVWNEPDIAYWHGSPEQYDELYDYAAAAVKRALPQARVGGPATTGPASAKAAVFLQQFLEHCTSGTNAATGEKGAPLDFITYHAKGRPAVVEGHVRMGINKNAEDVQKGFQIISSFPRFRNLPIVLSESDPEGCAACSARVYPQNAYRNGPLYASYTAAMMKNIFDLADREKTNIAGMLTWAFEFEDQPFFDGFRTLATNGIDKPVLNVFRMAGLMGGDRISAESSGRVPLLEILKDGVRGRPDVDALATRSDRSVAVLAWNYHDDDGSSAELASRSSHLTFHFTNLPTTPARMLLQHYRIDENHSNAWTAWKRMGSPQTPTTAQYLELESAGQLQTLESPRWIEAKRGQAEVTFVLPSQGVSLIRLSW